MSAGDEDLPAILQYLDPRALAFPFVSILLLLRTFYPSFLQRGESEPRRRRRPSRGRARDNTRRSCRLRED